MIIMKNRAVSITAVILCLLITASVFTACNKNKEQGETTTLAPGESWAPGSEPYKPVEISDVELVDLVKDALGDEAKDFDGDMSKLTDDQLSKVRQAAAVRGYEVTDDGSGSISIKKDDAKVTEVESSNYRKILTRAGVTNVGQTVNSSQYAEISKEAESQGVQAVTDDSGNVRIYSRVNRPSQGQTVPVNPDNVTGTAANTTGPVNTATQKSPTTENIATGGGNNGGNIDFTSTAGTVYINTKLIERGDLNTFGSVDYNNIYSEVALTEDNDIVAVGSTFSDTKGKSRDYSSAVIEAYSSKGKKLFTDILVGDKQTAFEDVAVLADGSIIAVGYTSARDLVDDKEYKCKGTLEGIMVKYNSHGKRQWIKLFGGSKDDEFYTVTASQDGGFIAGGQSKSADADLKDIPGEKVKSVIAKYDADGRKIWVRKVLSDPQRHNAVKGVAEAPDGSVYVSVETSANAGEVADFEGGKRNRAYNVIAKVNTDGSLAWTREFYEGGILSMNSICVADNGGVIVAGYYSTAPKGEDFGSFKDLYNGGVQGTSDGIVVKINPDGRDGWYSPTQLMGFENERLTGVAPARGGYVVTGYTKSTTRDFQRENRGDNDAFVYFISYGGKKQCMTSVGGSSADAALGIAANGQTVAICGYTGSDNYDFTDSGAAGEGGKNTVAYAYTFNLQQE